jgi:hypothetical protein
MNIFLEVVAGKHIYEFFLGEMVVFYSKLISVTTLLNDILRNIDCRKMNLKIAHRFCGENAILKLFEFRSKIF